MTVSIDGEGLDEKTYGDTAPCGCYFEKVIAGGMCTPCAKDGDCANSGKCRRGVCETK